MCWESQPQICELGAHIPIVLTYFPGLNNWRNPASFEGISMKTDSKVAIFGIEFSLFQDKRNCR